MVSSMSYTVYEHHGLTGCSRHVVRHEESQEHFMDDSCWCEPRLDCTLGNGIEVWVHADTYPEPKIEIVMVQ